MSTLRILPGFLLHALFCARGVRLLWGSLPRILRFYREGESFDARWTGRFCGGCLLLSAAFLLLLLMGALLGNMSLFWLGLALFCATGCAWLGLVFLAGLLKK